MCIVPVELSNNFVFSSKEVQIVPRKYSYATRVKVSTQMEYIHFSITFYGFLNTIEPDVN
jgi:hypothetical protein